MRHPPAWDQDTNFVDSRVMVDGRLLWIGWVAWRRVLRFCHTQWVGGRHVCRFGQGPVVYQLHSELVAAMGNQSAQLDSGDSRASNLRDPFRHPKSENMCESIGLGLVARWLGADIPACSISTEGTYLLIVLTHHLPQLLTLCSTMQILVASTQSSNRLWSCKRHDRR